MALSGGSEPEFVAIACLTSPQGLQGFCHVVAFGKTLGGQIPARLFAGVNESSARSVKVAEVKQAGGRVILRLEGSATREDAEGLRGQYLYARVEDLPGLGSDEYYHFELEGMVAFVGDDKIGVVETVHEYPTMDALELRKVDGFTVTIPFNRDSVPFVDREKRQLQVNRDILDELL